MSLADEVLAKHVVCHGTNCGHHPMHCEAHGEDVVPWPCESVRLALSLQAAEQVVEAARQARNEWIAGGNFHKAMWVLSDELDALAENDKGGRG